MLSNAGATKGTALKDADETLVQTVMKEKQTLDEGPIRLLEKLRKVTHTTLETLHSAHGYQQQQLRRLSSELQRASERQAQFVDRQQLLEAKTANLAKRAAEALSMVQVSTTNTYTICHNIYTCICVHTLL
jgi:aminoglycoside phosphotransferase (APT) family kinase protein